MARAKAKDLAGLAALGFLGYKLFGKGKDAMGPSATAKEKDDSDTRMKAQKDAVSGKRVTNESSYTGTTKNNSDAAKNIGYGGGDDSDKNLKRVTSGANRSVSASTPKSDKNEDFSNEGRTPVRGSSASPTYTSKTPAGDKKRTEGNEPMPSLRKVEARAASNKTDAMRNASRANVAAANRQKAMKANPEAQAAERVYPEELLVGGPGVKVVGTAAKNLANRGAKEIPEYAIPRLGGPATQTTTAAPRLGGPTPQLTGPSKTDLMARDRAARESARQEEMLRENARRSGLDPDNINPAVANKVRENMGGSDFSLGMKRGGMTKMASGGMTASRRGDGIASRGKTRGKIC